MPFHTPAEQAKRRRGLGGIRQRLEAARRGVRGPGFSTGSIQQLRQLESEERRLQPKQQRRKTAAQRQRDIERTRENIRRGKSIFGLR